MTEQFREPDHDTDLESDRMVETPETLRDDDPESPPMDRGSDASDRPLGAEKFGTTHSEEAEGESLDLRLSQEVPDTGEHDPIDDIVEADPSTFAASDADAEQTDDRVLGDAYGDGDGDPDEPVGRIVAPDEGAHTDTEKDMVATDLGRDGGGRSAEEAALHVEDER